jgi:endonuclease YncB( thermonuclease family)
MKSRAPALLASALAWFTVVAAAGGGPRLTGSVVAVVDGDTADVQLASGPIRVRLHAIDAPELGQADGPAAKQALAALVLGKPVLVEPYEQDSYDRLVARLWLGGTDVNAEMVKEGHAWTYRRYADDPAYCRHEKAARDQGRGLWALPVELRPAPWEWRRGKRPVERFTDYSNETVAACVAALGRKGPP